MYALHHLFVTKVEVAFAEAQAIKMQEALIAEEEEAERVAAELEGAKTVSYTHLTLPTKRIG